MVWVGGGSGLKRRWLFENHETNHKQDFVDRLTLTAFLPNTITCQQKVRRYVDGHRCVVTSPCRKEGRCLKRSQSHSENPKHQESLARMNKEKAKPFVAPALKSTLCRHHAEESSLTTWGSTDHHCRAHGGLQTPPPAGDLLLAAWYEGPGVPTLGQAGRTDDGSESWTEAGVSCPHEPGGRSGTLTMQRHPQYLFPPTLHQAKLSPLNVICFPIWNQPENKAQKHGV